MDMCTLLRTICLAVAATVAAAAQDGLPHYRIDVDAATKGALTLSELAESVEYVRLETADRCLLGNVYRFDVSENYVIALSREAGGCFLFSRRTGRFVAAIGRTGQGPGEYASTPDNCMIDEKNQRAVVVVRNGREDPVMMYYSLAGKYTGSEAFANPAFPLPVASRSLGDGRVLLMYFNLSEDLAFTYEIRAGGRVVRQAVGAPARGSFAPGFFIMPHFSSYSHAGRTFVKSGLLNDTVYAIDGASAVVPAYTLSYGRREVTVADLERRVHDREAGFAQLMPEYLFGTERFLIASFYLERKRIFRYLDRATGRTYRFDSPEGIPNDYDGGPDFVPQAQYGRRLVAFCNAFSFEEQRSAGKSRPARGPEAAVRAFRKMYDSLDAEDNPVVVIVTVREQGAASSRAALPCDD
ncbi:MAG: 6-bladed beta-propeller [Tannerella sp.]|nr:6-bladed beta-propeller [Tannerella sp.]